jgi:CRISPR/Cas system-associated endonuclease Cas1
MEPLRVPAVDRWVIKVCNRNELAPTDFVRNDAGIRLRQGTFGCALTAWEQYWADARLDVAIDQAVDRLCSAIRRAGFIDCECDNS